jgi:hypothetical protein
MKSITPCFKFVVFCTFRFVPPLLFTLFMSGCHPTARQERTAKQDTMMEDPGSAHVEKSGRAVIRPGVYHRALRNPLKGFTGGTGEWRTLQMVYIYWNDIENDESDGIDKIRRVLDERWKDFPRQNIKVIPRVILHWTGEERTYWPADMETGDYTSEQFKFRVVRLIERLGELWNDDPRVAFVEVGLIGRWGEHHNPNPTPEVQALISDAFRRAMPDKLASVRHPWKEFEPGQFGVYWDSFAHYQQMYSQGRLIREMFKEDPAYWQRNYIGGEVAYDWGDWKIQPGETPAHSVRLPVHRDFIINTIRWLHTTQLRWIGNYEQHATPETFDAVRAGAEIMQKAFGYRFILDQVTFPTRVQAGDAFEVTLNVRNEGSAPFYYRWPLELALLDPETLEPVWKSHFEEVDIRDWLPGTDWPEPIWEEYDKWPGFVARWPEGELEYATPPLTYTSRGTFTPDIPEGEYILSLAILDPGGNVPSVRFATTNYLRGGRHPIGVIAIGEGEGGPLPPTFRFDSPHADRTLHYLIP